MSASQYGAVRGCSSCPFRGDPCHEARQRAQDPEIETGRHYECEFYRAIEAARRKAPRRPEQRALTGW